MRSIVFVSILLALVLVHPVEAMVFVDGPIYGNSWGALWIQTQTETNNWGEQVGPFTSFRVDFVPALDDYGNLFELPGLSGLTSPWAVASGYTETYTGATGPGGMDVNFATVFQGNPDLPGDDPDAAVPTRFHFAAYNGTELRIAQWVYVDPDGNWDAGFENTWDPGAIPEPTSLMLVGFGLAGLVAWRRVRG